MLSYKSTKNPLPLSICSLKTALKLLQQMAVWFFVLLFLVGEVHATDVIQTDLQAAMAEMRSKSYHGFVILLKILNSTHHSLQDSDITFLMPGDRELSRAGITPDHLEDFLLSHSIPSALLLDQLLHFPNGTLVPSSIPTKMISITNTRKQGLCVNNARIITPNVCLNSSIRCHGISTTLAFDYSVSFPDALPANQSAAETTGQKKKKREAKSLPCSIVKKTRPLH